MPRGTETIKVIKTLKKGKLSTTPTGPTAGSFDIPGCQVIPRGSYEEGKGWTNIDGWDVWVLKNPPPEPVLSSYQVVVRGETYQIKGKPGEFDKRQKFKGMRIVLEKVGTP